MKRIATGIYESELANGDIARVEKIGTKWIGTIAGNRVGEFKLKRDAIDAVVVTSVGAGVQGMPPKAFWGDLDPEFVAKAEEMIETYLGERGTEPWYRAKSWLRGVRTASDGMPNLHEWLRQLLGIRAQGKKVPPAPAKDTGGTIRRKRI